MDAEWVLDQMLGEGRLDVLAHCLASADDFEESLQYTMVKLRVTLADADLLLFVTELFRYIPAGDFHKFGVVLNLPEIEIIKEYPNVS